MKTRDVLRCGNPPAPLSDPSGVRQECGPAGLRARSSWKGAGGLTQPKPWRTVVAAVCLAGLIGTVRSAERFTDDFADGLIPRYWTVVGDVDLYDLDVSMGDVRISKPVGGEYTFQSLGLTFRSKLRGDFDVSVDLVNATITRVDGVPGNQVQLNVRFGGQGFYVVRSDENFGGDNLHVFLDPQRVWVGTMASSATSGRMRVVRIDTQVQGWFESTLIFQGSYNTEDAEVDFALQNNGTRDATAVVFDNFSVTADSLVPPERFTLNWFTVDGGGGRSAGQRFEVLGTIGQPDAGEVMIGSRFSVTGGFWRFGVVQIPGAPVLTILPAGVGMAQILWAPDPPGFVLQMSPTLTSPAWMDAPSGSTNPAFVLTTSPIQFYRLIKP